MIQVAYGLYRRSHRLLREPAPDQNDLRRIFSGGKAPRHTLQIGGIGFDDHPGLAQSGVNIDGVEAPTALGRRTVFPYAGLQPIS
jgi:hypothetical protein